MILKNKGFSDQPGSTLVQPLPNMPLESCQCPELASELEMLPYTTGRGLRLPEAPPRLRLVEDQLEDLRDGTQLGHGNILLDILNDPVTVGMNLGN